MSSDADVATPATTTVKGTTFVPLTIGDQAANDEPRVATSPHCVISSRAARQPAQLVSNGPWPNDIELGGGLDFDHVIL